LLQALPKSASTPWLLSDRRWIQWNPTCECTLDVVQFERLSQKPHRVPQAIDLYCGDFLADFYDDWIFPERERLRKIQSRNLESLIEEHRSNRDFAAGISCAQKLVLHDPWREDIIRTLMSLRYASGDRAGALQEYDSFRQHLRLEMDVEPMPETVSAYESIIRNAPSYLRGSAQTSEKERSREPSATPFLGRDRERRHCTIGGIVPRVDMAALR